MRPCYNVLSPSNGEVILKPTQDMVIGAYYLTLMITHSPCEFKTWFANENDALLAFFQKKITIHTPILVRYSLADFQIKIQNGKIKFIDTRTKLKENEKEIGQCREVLFLYESKKEPNVWYGRTPHFRLVRVRSERDLVGVTADVRIETANKTALEGALI
jgi:DNA-directed RNA polymerase beta' subunit